MAGYHNAYQRQSREYMLRRVHACRSHMHAGHTNITAMQSMLSHQIGFYDLQHWRLQLHLKPKPHLLDVKLDTPPLRKATVCKLFI